MLLEGLLRGRADFASESQSSMLPAWAQGSAGSPGKLSVHRLLQREALGGCKVSSLPSVPSPAGCYSPSGPPCTSLTLSLACGLVAKGSKLVEKPHKLASGDGSSAPGQGARPGDPGHGASSWHSQAVVPPGQLLVPTPGCDAPWAATQWLD